MPVPSFGFSVGDFVALAQLIVTVSKALSESRGSQAEYQGLVQALLSLLRTVNTAEEIALRCTLDHAASRDPAIHAPLNAIAREREICHKLIQDFLARSEKYTSSFVHGFGRAKAIKKISWLLFHSSDVEKLERELKIHTDAIHLYTCGLGFQSLQLTLASNAATLGQIDKRTMMMYDMISQIFTMMPKQLGYTWEGGCSPNEKPLRLLDALGRDLMIPAIFLSSRQVFQDTLEIIHRGLPGHRKILMQEYNVADEEGDGKVIDKSKDREWAKAVRAGNTVSLNMIFQTFLHTKDSQTCPRCKSLATGPTLEGQRRRCQMCNLTFHIFEEVRLQEADAAKPDRKELPGLDADVEDRAKKHRPKDRAKPTPRAKKTNEQDLFRRIHYVHERVEKISSLALMDDRTGKLGTNDKFMEDLPPLHRAAALGDIETLQRLLDGENADIESKGGCDEATPLHYASYQGQEEAAIFLLERGAQVMSQDSDGATPLHWSIPFGHLSMFRLLLESGADMHYATIKGRTPLHWCAWKNQPSMARFIIDEGADVNVLDGDGCPPLLHISGSCAELVQMLADEGADLHMQARSSRAALHFAVEDCSVDTVNLLLELGADVNLGDWQDVTPLMLAIKREQDSGRICKVLLDNGAHLKSPAGTVLHDAAGNSDAVAVLLEYDIDINFKDHKGLTPLHLAVKAGDRQSCRQLLTAGADVDATDFKGKTALHLAMALGDAQILRDLLELGAQILPDDDGIGPLESIESLTPAECVHLLVKHGANVHGTTRERWVFPLHRAARASNAACVAALIDLGADVNSIDNSDMHPIHAAVAFGSVECCQVLLDAGVDIEATAASRVHSPLTPLYFAVVYDRPDAVRFLLERGANPLKSNGGGNHPLSVAALGNCLEAARALLEHESAREQLALSGVLDLRPIDHAASGGFVKMAKLLYTHEANTEELDLEDLLHYAHDQRYRDEIVEWYNRDILQ